VKARKLMHLNVWPVVQRELRVGARRPFNYWVRVGAAAAGTLLLWAVAAGSKRPTGQLGGWLFASLHTLLLGLIAVIVPAMAADCIAREKREGTLGLLFITPLSAGGIVAGKALALALRAFTLWLAVLPILMIPFLTGGVTWLDALSAFSLEFCATVLCLAAGLLASSMSKERNTAFLLAFVFAAVFLLLFAQLFELVIFVGWGMGTYHHNDMPTLNHWWGLSWEFNFLFSGLVEIGGFPGWGGLSIVSPVLGKLWQSLCLSGPPIALMILFLVARFASRRIQRSWQDKVPSLRWESFVRRFCPPFLQRRFHPAFGARPRIRKGRFCTPLLERRFQRKMERTLDWNPIAWLQRYSWKARASKWGLCLAFLLVECCVVESDLDTFESVQAVLLMILAAACTFVGVSSFLAEKRSGALELILISPISVNKIIFGRVWGLWRQFLPAALILAVFDFSRGWSGGELWPDPYYGQSSHIFNEDNFIPRFIFGCGFLVLPFCATYSALRVKNLIVAGVLTWVGLVLPLYVAAILTSARGELADHKAMFCFLLLLANLALVALVSFLLRHSLSRRIYSF